MAARPAAEIAIDESLVRALIATLADRIPDAAALPVAHVADGWDCSVWRLGDELAVRLPRRQSVAALLEGEGRALAEVAGAVEATGVRVPAVVARGAPSPPYPWPWAVVPYFPGTSGIEVARVRRTGWARPLAAALRALHTPAPDGRPVNPYRGVPLADRAGGVEERLGRLAAALDPADHAALERAWREGLAASPWDGPAVWIHGDAHPGNLIARGEELVAIIDFIDVTGGDPAYDLAAAWLVFDATGRRVFMDASPHVDDDTWARARAWAAALAALLIEAGDDAAYVLMAQETIAQLR